VGRIVHRRGWGADGDSSSRKAGHGCLRIGRHIPDPLGRHGAFSSTAQPGDFVYVPAYLPHKEINLSEDTEFIWVVARSTPQPIVVNLPDAYWQSSPANGNN
jgi:hypothetical protein